MKVLRCLAGEWLIACACCSTGGDVWMHVLRCVADSGCVECKLDTRLAFVSPITLSPSPVWPYTKNILLFLAWFAPLTPRARGQLLAWTNRFGRWGLVDVMAVIVIVVGTNFRLVLGTVHVVAEARNAICTFAVRWVHYS